MDKQYTVKANIIGHSPGEDRAVKVFNRTLRRADRGMEHGGDARHMQVVVEQMCVLAYKVITTSIDNGHAVTPGRKEGEREGEEEDTWEKGTG